MTPIAGAGRRCHSVQAFEVRGPHQINSLRETSMSVNATFLIGEHCARAFELSWVIGHGAGLGGYNFVIVNITRLTRYSRNSL